MQIGQKVWWVQTSIMLGTDKRRYSVEAGRVVSCAVGQLVCVVQHRDLADRIDFHQWDDLYWDRVSADDACRKVRLTPTG